MTERLQLMSNMKDFRLSVQNGAGGDYKSVTPKVSQEDVGRMWALPV